MENRIYLFQLAAKMMEFSSFANDLLADRNRERNNFLARVIS